MLKRVLKHNFSLLNVDHVQLGSKWNYKGVISPYYRIYYIDSGDGQLSDVRSSVKLEPGYLYIIPNFTLCNLSCESNLGQYFVQFFEESPDGMSLFANSRSISKVKATDIDVKNFKRLLEINPGRGINRSDNPNFYEKSIFYKEYQDLNTSQSTATFFETQGIILQLLSRFLAPQTFIQKEWSHIPVKVYETISYILLNINTNLSVAFLAKRVNQNVDYFSRQFELHTGDRPINYIHEKRIERAQYLIVTTQLTFPQIAVKAGFENVYYFSKIFKKITGTSPGRYRKQLDQVNY
jgi:AraC family transcriptional regulator